MAWLDRLTFWHFSGAVVVGSLLGAFCGYLLGCLILGGR